MPTIITRFTTDTGPLVAGLRRASAQSDRASRDMRRSFAQAERGARMMMGAVTVLAGGAGLGALVSSSLRAGDALAKTSDKLGIATERLAGLRFAAEQTGVSSRTMDMALQRMTRRLSEAAQGTGEARNAIKELGLSAKDLANLSPDQQFAAIAEKMAQVTTQADRVRLAFKLFDSEGVAVVNTLRLGSAGLEDMQHQANALGIAMSRVDAAKIEAANDALNRAKKAAEGVANVIAIQAAPIIEHMANLLVGTGINAIEMQNKVKLAFDVMARAVGVMADGLHGGKIAFIALKVAGQGVAFGILEAFRIMAAGVQAILNGIQTAANITIAGLNLLPGVEIALLPMLDFADRMSVAADVFLTNMGESIDELKAKLAEPLPSTGIIGAMEKIEAAAQGRALEIEALTQHEAAVTQVKQEGVEARAEIEKMGMAAQVQTVSGALQGMLAQGSAHSKKMFELNKAAGISNAIVSTAQGAAKALEWGWPMGPIFAGMIYAAGAAQVASIASQRFGGGAASAPSVGSASPSAATPEGGGNQNVSVQVASDRQLFRRDELVDIVKQIGEIASDGGVSGVNLSFAS